MINFDFDKKTTSKFIALTIKANAINAINSYIIYGAPSPLTYYGFLENLAFRLNEKISNMEFLPIVHNYEKRGNKKGFNQLRSSEREAAGKAQTDIPRADIYFTIIFRFENDIKEDDLKLAIRKSRFAGGRIDQKNIKIKIDDSLGSLLASTKKGFCFSEVELKLPIDNPFEYYSKQLKKTKENGFRSPTLLGYSLLSEPIQRDNSRFGHPHTFADPLHGIIQYKKFEKFNHDRKTGWWKLSTSNKKILIKNK